MASIESDTHPTTLTVETLKELMKSTNPAGSNKSHGRSTPKKVQPIGGVMSPLFLHSTDPPDHPFDEVYQNLFLGDLSLAHDKEKLQELGITHIINAAQGPKFNQINTSQEYYADVNVTFLGINAIDTPRFQMHKHFQAVADFMEEAFKHSGRIYVHCQQGLSRSATLVLAYLVLKQAMSLEEAAVSLRQKRPVMPNDGFLQQLIDFENERHSHAASSQGHNEAGDSSKSCDKTAIINHCDIKPCDTESVLTNSVQTLQLTDSDSEADNSQPSTEEAPVSATVSKPNNELLTLEEVKEFMSYVVQDKKYTKSTKKKRTQGTILYVRKGKISSPAFVNDIDEVYPGICIGNHKIAKDLRGLKAVGITHILNTAYGQGSMCVDTDQDYYANTPIQYSGFPAKDIHAYKLSKHFDSAAEFIANAVQQKGKILVHCHQGRSRSAAIVLAYLMLKQDTPLLEAIRTVRERRWIWPNDGFISQLIDLNNTLFCKQCTE